MCQEKQGKYYSNEMAMHMDVTPYTWRAWQTHGMYRQVHLGDGGMEHGEPWRKRHRMLDHMFSLARVARLLEHLLSAPASEADDRKEDVL